jgi:hypothetical protein
MMKFEDKVKHYFKLDQEEKSVKKEKTPLNVAIKDHMKSNALNAVEVDGIKVSYQVQERTSMNEDKLLLKLKSLGLTEAIVTVEKPDSESVSKLIYDGKLTTEELESCIEKKYVEVLSVKGGKK